jgi:hypothetical protein
MHTMQKSNFYLLLLPLFLFLASCSDHFYSTASPNIFLPKEKNCHQITASYGTDGVALSGGTAITNHFMMTLNARYNRRVKSNYVIFPYYPFLTEPIGYVADHSAGEAEMGLGYFNSFGTSKQGRYSIQGGVNLGVAEDIARDESYYYDIFGPYFNVFIQPSFGFVSKHFELGVTAKLSLGKMGTGTLEPYIKDKGNGINLASFESATRISYGFEKWKMFLQLSTITGNSNFDQVRLLQSGDFAFAFPINASIGIKKTFGAP